MKPGDILRPLLFVLLMDDIMKRFLGEIYNVGNWRLKLIGYSETVFRDNLLLSADDRELAVNLVLEGLPKENINRKYERN